MKRTIVIGDLHGMCHEAHLLLEKCQATANDRIILLGDLVDRGPDSAGCVDLAMRIEKEQGAPACVLGNHEERHLSYDDAEKQHGKADVRSESHMRTRSQLKPRHYEYMRTLPMYIRLPEYNAACVHAGVWPQRSLEQQSKRHLLHIQSIRPFAKSPNGVEQTLWPSRVPSSEKDWRFWTHFWGGPERIIFGHSVLNKPLVNHLVVGIDGGGCFGKELWAFVLPDNQIVRQPCPSTGSKRADRELYLIDGDVGTY